MTRLKVSVLRGGPSSEYDVSLKSGAAVLAQLPEEKYEARDVFIDKSGTWHQRGIPVEPSSILQRTDVVFNALHGAYGEDGTLQRFLDTHRIPYTGSTAMASAVAMNKLLTKKRALQTGIQTPQYAVLAVAPDLDRQIFDLFRSFPQPSVIKPINSGSSVGVTLARDYHSFVDGIRNAFTHSPKVLIEEYIRGREATCGVVDDFRHEHLYALPPIEIVPPDTCTFFNYDAKYGGATKEVCPGYFSYEEKQAIQNAAKAIHEALGLRHYSRSDFIVSPRGVYFLEVNTLPGLTKESLLPKALDAVGCRFHSFLDHVISLAGRR